MKKAIRFLFVMTALVVVFASACSNAAAPAPTQAPLPVEVVPTTAPPVEPPPTQPLATVQTFAPACAAATSCSAPDVKDTTASDRYCVEKIAYQNILVDDGVTFEVLDPTKLMCADNGTMVDGKRVIECHGLVKEAWASQVKFTNTACGGGASLATGTGQCQEGLVYDAAQNCCAPLTNSDAGSVTITINMGTCY
ncbi:MAG: hypothetical protein HYZ23_02155 [Chloroflexi bacterium]|nr:hypothetical protein [Chloroflexota bacterium]